MERQVAWITAALAAGLFAWTNGWIWLAYSPSWGRYPDPTWSQFCFFWVGPMVLYWLPLPGFWLLGSASAAGGGRWAWRWWIGGLLAAVYVLWEIDAARSLREIFPGYKAASIAQALLAIWPVFYWGMRSVQPRPKRANVPAPGSR